MKKKIMFPLLAALLLLFAGQSVMATGAAEEGASGKKVTITQWLFPFVSEEEDREMFSAFLPELHKDHPNVEVEFEFFPWSGRRDRMLTAIAAKLTPDVVYLNDDMKPLFYPNLLDLNQYIDAAELEDFKPGALDSAKYKGELAYLPVLINSVAHFVNLDIAEELGFSAEELLEKQYTWEEFEAFCEIAKKGGYYALTMGPADAGIVDELSNWIYQAGADYYNEDMTKCTLNTPEAIRAFEFVVGLWEKEYVNPADIDKKQTEASEGIFAQGKSAAIMAQNQAYTTAWKPANPDLRVALMYALKDKTAASNGTVAGYGSFKFAENPEAAVAWIKVLTGANAMKVLDTSLSFIPPRFSVDAAMKAEMNDPIFDRAVENSQWFRPTVPASPVGAAANEEIKIAFQKMLIKQQTVEEALNEVTAKINKLLDDYYRKQQQ